MELSRTRIPSRMWGGIARYIIDHIEPGDFLVNVAQNDLCGACRCADDENQLLLFDYVKFFYNHAPSACWGTPERVEAWLADKHYDCPIHGTGDGPDCPRC